MCGISAIFGNSNKDREQQLKYLLSAIKHRGDSLFEIKSFSECVLGTNRLKIVDPMLAVQPVTDGTDSLAVVFNGEIYNYKDLREKLIRVGSDFKTGSDTEVLLHGYKQWGEELPKKLDGMFAFVIFDRLKNKVFAARDPFGIKPLYFAKYNQDLFFASEVKSFLFFKEKINSLDQIKPGHYYDTSKREQCSYYSIDEYLVSRHRARFERGYKHSPEYIQLLSRDLKKRLTQSVRKRMQTDLAIGVFLSGGIDSSAITYLANQYKEVTAYSIGMEGSPDIENAKILAQHLNIKLKTKIFTLQEILPQIRRVIYHLETFDTVMVEDAIPTYLVAGLARQDGLKIMLCGDGSDELFGGYEKLIEIPSNRLSEEIIFYLKTLHKFDLQRVDRMTMAHCLETRVPFLDKSFIEFALDVPVDLKVFRGNKSIKEKYILRKAFEDVLPPEIVRRRKASFFQSSGISRSLSDWLDERISMQEFEQKTKQYQEWGLTSKRELFYFEIWREFFPYLTPETHFRLCGVKKYREV